jgi:hypothetical protein
MISYRQSAVLKMRKFNIYLISIFFTILMTTSSLGNVVAASSPSSNPVSLIEANINSVADSLNTAQAISLAESTQQYQTYSQNYTLAFNSIANTWATYSSGDVNLRTVNPVFSFTNSSGFQGYLVVTENPALTAVTQVTTQTSNTKMTSYTNWSGYTILGNSGATNPVYEAYANWYVPAASQPYSNACLLTHCDFAIWPGLTATQNGNSGIVQAGTDSGLYCTIGCSYYYYGWYEFYPSASVTCPSFPVSAGDLVDTTVLNAAEYGGSSTVYDLYVYDSSSGLTCSVTNHSYTSFTTPYYAQYIGERPSIGGSLARLPDFTTTTMTGDIYYSSTYTGISTPYGNGWYYQNLMQNSGYTNITPGSISSSAFSLPWSTSSGT